MFFLSLRRHRTIILAVISVWIMNFAGCGTILYPERKGQVKGRIDPGIAVLDGVGLLLFIVPGVIAFAVDFSNGTIYLPERRSSLESDPEGLNMVRTHRDINLKLLEKVIQKRLQINADLSDGKVLVQKASSIDEIKDRISLLSKS